MNSGEAIIVHQFHENVHNKTLLHVPGKLQHPKSQYQNIIIVTWYYLFIVRAGTDSLFVNP